MRIILTGATGFIGKELLSHLDEKNLTILSRNPSSNNKYINASLEDFLEKKVINEQFDVAIHLAGLAHKSYQLAKFRKINVNDQSTTNLHNPTISLTQRNE